MKPKRLAFFSPLKPDRTGVADYAEKLLPHLAQHFDIDLYVEKSLSVTQEVFPDFNVFYRRDYELQRRKTPYDLNVYQIGNSYFHRFIYPVMVRYPGAVILHDANIHHSRAYTHLYEQNLKYYLNEITWNHGDEGRRIGPAIAHGYQSPVLYDMYPMLKIIGESAASVLVHNQFAEQRIQQYIGENRIFRIHLPYVDEGIPDYQKARNELGIEQNQLVIASFGFVTYEKRLHQSLKAFEFFQQEYPQSQYVLVGGCLDDQYGKQLQEYVSAIPNTHITGYVDDKTFKKWLAACDICISLRYPTQGESSDVLIRIMGAGKPVITPAYRQFLEVPPDCCVHIPLWPNEAYSVLAALRELVDNPNEKDLIGKNARNYILENHSLEKWIESMTEALEKTTKLPTLSPLSSRCVLKHIRVEAVEDSIVQKLIQWGDFAQHPYIVQPLAKAIHELGIDDTEETP
ncbi:MAG: glycosyltransferase family 4 protein [bacterium]